MFTLVLDENSMEDPLCNSSFGSMVSLDYVTPDTKTAKDQSRIHEYGKQVLFGLFFGYALYAGGIWKGDVLVADLEELETMDASEIYSKKTQCERCDISHRKRKIYFSNRRWTKKSCWKRSRLENIHLETAATSSKRSHIDFLGESEGSLPPPHDSFPDAGEAINDLWSMSGNFKHRHHVEPGVKLYSPREESFPIPLKYIDVSRTTHTNLDVKRRETHR